VKETYYERRQELSDLSNRCKDCGLKDEFLEFVMQHKITFIGSYTPYCKNNASIDSPVQQRNLISIAVGHCVLFKTGNIQKPMVFVCYLLLLFLHQLHTFRIL
jgi:hypothetical protein